MSSEPAPAQEQAPQEPQQAEAAAAPAAVAEPASQPEAEKPQWSPFTLDGLELCVGTWAWGDTTPSTLGSTWAAAGASNTEAENRAAFDASVAAGVRFFDTAEVYSFGKSETLLGQFAQAAPAPGVLIATKFAPLPWHVMASSLRTALNGSLARLRRPWVELYQVHSAAFSIRRVETWAEELADAYKDHLIRGVGVSNYNSDQVRRTHAALQKHGVPLLTLQIEYSLLHRLPETSGLMATCNELGIKVLAYSPLAMGRLSGKYTTQEQLDALKGRQFGNVEIGKLLPLIEALRKIGAAHGGKTPPQVALNWIIRKGAIPIVGAKNASQATENAGATGWAMTPEEVAELDALSVVGKANFWQGSSN